MEQIPKSLFGFNKSAEILNGRAAMLGFVILFSIELFLNQPLLRLINFID